MRKFSLFACLFILRTQYGHLRLWITVRSTQWYPKNQTQRRFRCNFSGFSSSPSRKRCESHVDLVLAMRRLRSGKREAHALKNACRWIEPADDASPAQNNATPSFPIQRWFGVGGRGMPPVRGRLQRSLHCSHRNILATVTIPPATYQC